MGEELPDGTIQGYTGQCNNCLEYVNSNMQGNLSAHDCDGIGCYTITHENLQAYIEVTWKNMSEEERSKRRQYVDPLFEETIISEPGDIIRVNEITHVYKIIKRNKVKK